MRAGLGAQNALRRASAEYEEDDRDKEKARIKNVHAQKEQSLVRTLLVFISSVLFKIFNCPLLFRVSEQLQDLQANMLEKKRALEDRFVCCWFSFRSLAV